jgi:hypothetical protein
MEKFCSNKYFSIFVKTLIFFDLKTKIYVSVLFISIFFLENLTYSQNFTRANDWKKYRKEVILQVGISQFLGDLGGLNGTGKDFSPADIEFRLTRPSVSIAYRYKFSKTFNIHSSFNYLLVKGDDNLTQEKSRNNRNLNFKSNIFELGTRAEFSFFRNKAGHRYGLKRTVMRRHKSKSDEFMAFIGVAAFYFNPKGKNPETGAWVKLQPLHTEGQGLPGGPPQYKRVGFVIPMGVCWRTIIQKKWSIGLELNYRKTFTDYIDDVSGVYYDKAALENAYGSTSAILSDPNKGLIPGATNAGEQRGDIQKDTYMSAQITIGKFFAPKRSKSRLRSKF